MRTFEAHDKLPLMRDIKETFIRAAIYFTFALVGGALGHRLVGDVRAREPLDQVFDSVESGDFVLRDGEGRTSARLSTSGDGTGALFIFDTAGRVRLTAGSYQDGDPSLVLNDPQGNASLILRLAGTQHSPVVVFKAKGQDRMVLGLAMNDSKQEPFLVTMDQSGNPTHHFGVFDK